MRLDKVDYAKTDAGPFNVLNAQHRRLRQTGKRVHESNAKISGDRIDWTKL